MTVYKPRVFHLISKIENRWRFGLTSGSDTWGAVRVQECEGNGRRDLNYANQLSFHSYQANGILPRDILLVSNAEIAHAQQVFILAANAFPPQDDKCCIVKFPKRS